VRTGRTVTKGRQERGNGGKEKEGQEHEVRRAMKRKGSRWAGKRGRGRKGNGLKWKGNRPFDKEVQERDGKGRRGRQGWACKKVLAVFCDKFQLGRHSYTDATAGRKPPK